MDCSQTTVGLVHIGEMVWERRPSRQFQLIDGALRPKPVPGNRFESHLPYLPHSAGLLQVYAQKYASDAQSLTFLPQLYTRLPLEQAVQHLLPADVVGFSVYVWNIEYSLALARELRQRRPDVLLVLGGPQVPDRAEEFLRANPFIDVVCHGEGERTFLEILERRHERSWHGVPSTSFVASDGRFVVNERRPRLTDLDEIPSPMLDGAYDEIMRQRPGGEWLATWETNRGCPFACSFCDWGSATASRIWRYSEERLYQEIDWLADHGIHHLFVCDANFGMLKRDVDGARRLADTYAERGMGIAVSVQNTKNRTDRSEEIQRIFKQSGVVSFGASISLQSVDTTTLKAIRRHNISLDAFDRLQKHYASQGLDTYTDLIIGLPGESYDSFTKGIDTVIRNGQFNRVAFYECSVLPNAPMAQPDYRKEYAVETVSVRIICSHASLDRTDNEVPEFIDIVVSTSSMDSEDWVRARVFAHFVELLFYDRLLHVPLVLLGSLGLDYRRMFEAFMDADPSRYPLTAATSRRFQEHARALRSGGPQYVASPEWLNLWWPVDQHALITLAEGGDLPAFYEEARQLLVDCAGHAGSDIDPVVVQDAVRLNQAMFAIPFELVDETVETTYPVAESYQALLAGQPLRLERRASACRVERSGTIWMSWTDWLEDLVRRVYLRDLYLYPIRIEGRAQALELAGAHMTGHTAATV